MNISNFCLEYDLGKVSNISKITGGLMHKMFKVETTKGLYAIKVLNKEVMSRKNAYSNFIISETISNLANKHGINVSSAIKINNSYLTKFNEMYYMVFDYVDGKVLKDSGITSEHCKKIGKILAQIHSLDYKEIDLEPKIIKYKRLVDWDSFINNPNFNKMSYSNLFLENYKKYNSILKRANERYNNSNINQTICHRDMDPKNVMWHKDLPIIIDWESAQIANPERELLEDALSWSGFLSNNFNEDKFATMFKEYAKYRSIKNIDWYLVICGNLVGRIGWLQYNLERSLGICSNDEEEMNLAEVEVCKAIKEINLYLELIGTMYNIINSLTIKEENDYSNLIEIIINSNQLLIGKKYKLITAGFTNTIYNVENYIVKICTNKNNESRFKSEIDFYNQNKNNDKLPKLFFYDISKKTVPYYYEIIEQIQGKTLYEVWYKITDEERKNIIINIIDILKSFHNIDVEKYDFNNYIKEQIKSLLESCHIDDPLFTKLLIMCDTYFKENKFGLIHGDLHFDNFIYDNGKISLLDFERCMNAPIDYDFKIFSRYYKEPWLWASEKTDMLTVESDYQNLMELFIENYQNLKEVSYLKERLIIYNIIDLLKSYKMTNDVEQLEEAKNQLRKIL